MKKKTRGKFTIEVDKSIIDKFFMEHCLNLYHSGIDPNPLIVFYALAKNWHYSKLMFLYEEMYCWKGE